MNKELLAWAKANAPAMCGHHAALFLEQEGGRSELIPIETAYKAVRDTVCNVAISPNQEGADGRIEIVSLRDLSAFVCYNQTNILYVLGETAFLGMAIEAKHNSEDDQYTIVGLVNTYPKAEVCGEH